MCALAVPLQILIHLLVAKPAFSFETSLFPADRFVRFEWRRGMRPSTSLRLLMVSRSLY